jgi:drug/metabolite transporter (DMT)-like permease
VLITLGAALFLGERLGPRRIAGVVVALIGALIVIRPGRACSPWWALLPLAMRCSYAGNALLTRKIGAQESPWASMIYGALFGTMVAGAVPCPLSGSPVDPADLVALFALIGCLGTGRSFASSAASPPPRRRSSPPLPILASSLPPSGVGAFRYQWPDRWTVVGALVIVGAGFMSGTAKPWPRARRNSCGRRPLPFNLATG